MFVSADTRFLSQQWHIPYFIWKGSPRFVKDARAHATLVVFQAAPTRPFSIPYICVDIEYMYTRMEIYRPDVSIPPSRSELSRLHEDKRERCTCSHAQFHRGESFYQGQAWSLLSRGVRRLVTFFSHEFFPVQRIRVRLKQERGNSSFRRGRADTPPHPALWRSSCCEAAPNASCYYPLAAVFPCSTPLTEITSFLSLARLAGPTNTHPRGTPLFQRNPFLADNVGENIG